MAKIRLDELVLKRGLADTRSQAAALIMAGKIMSGTTRLDKAGKKYEPDLELTLIAPPPFVSRAGEKLDGFLNAHPQVDPTGAIALDIGACTGGFTDCLLQRGAAEVTCIDVGHSQLHPKMANHPAVTSLEAINARYVTAEDLPHPLYDILVMDVAFISQTKILPNVWALLKQGGYFISLVKPQFEISKEQADRCGGVIKDDVVRDEAVEMVLGFARENLPGCQQIGFEPSQIKGSSGNQEYLVGWYRADT